MANAFRDISAASTSSSKPSYDVFINHRGVDVKRTLASSIYSMLDLMGVQAFLDQEELEVGDSFPQAIHDAISSASVNIAIFSPKYAESPWCLEELSLMLRVKANIIPVFYHVNPSDLRFVTRGIYADAFYGHRRKGRYTEQKIREWEVALSRVSYLSGCTAENRDEGKLLREIVETALHKMRKMPLEVATFPVGLEEAVQDFEREVGSSSRSENVHIVGIVGMGGSGKTTLAIELYNRKCSSIRRSCFLRNVRDAASTNTLHKLQEKLLNDLGIQLPTFYDKDKSMGMLATVLKSMAVLVVLDDVDHVDQLEALFPHKVMHSIGRGSCIIVTTRGKNVLTSWGISSIYHMKPLDPFNAKQLFCRHAFLKPQPGFEHQAEKSHSFQDLIDRFVEACNGLPLSLKVFGAMMNGKSKDYWEAQLHKISKILPKEITERLQLSYDALDPELQQMFLDLACFFIGETKSLVVSIWDGSGWSGEVGWEMLVNKGLVGLDKEGNIDMHDHLRDLGRQIARNVSPARIWKEEHMHIEEQRTQIRGIMVGSWRDALSGFNPAPLGHLMEKMEPSLRKLQLLALKGDDFREELVASSRNLVWLRLCDFYGASLPSWLSLANLRVLRLDRARNLTELWQDNVEPPLQLRELIMEKPLLTCFRGLPRSIGHLRHLKKIVLDGGGSGMRVLPEEFCDLQSLEFLELSYFPELSSLPHDFGKLIKLQSLNLTKVELRALPDSFKELTGLQSVSISYSRSFMFTSEMLDVLEFMTELQILRFEACPQLKELPHLTTLVSLRQLDLSDSGLRELPNIIGQLTKLETLTLRSDNLTRLPESLGALSCLTSLKIGGDKLTSLPESLGTLCCLTSLEIEDCEMLESLPESLGHLTNLESLSISGTPVVETGLGIGSPSGCNLKSLKSLYLHETRVCKISISDDCCPSLEELTLEFNNYLTEIETLPGSVRKILVRRCKTLKNMTGISGLQKLERLTVAGCRDLEVLPCPAYMHSMGHTIEIRGCPVLKGYDDYKDDYDHDDFLYGPVVIENSDEEDDDDDESG